MRIFRDYFYGLFLPFTAFRLILSRKKLLILSILPLVITIGLSIAGLTAFKTVLMEHGIKLLADWGWATEGLGVQVASFMLSLILIVVGALTFSIVAGVIASPFNDFLAEAAEPLAKPALPALLKEQETWSFRLRSIWIDIVKTLVVGVVQAALLVSSLIVIWIPGLNIVFLAFTVLLLTYQYLTYPQTRRGMGVLESLRFLRKHMILALGLGTSLGFLFAIPIISAFALPLAVVSGTLLFGRAVAMTAAPKVKISESQVNLLKVEKKQ